MSEKKYLCIDLKSFFASVECVERGLNPLTTNLVVANPARTEKTICLAVTPALKAYGISGRARLFEVISRVEFINQERRRNLKQDFTGKSFNSEELASNPRLELSYITAPPRMAKYIEYSTKIYEIYLKYVAPEDMHIYSVDEVFIDITGYLNAYNNSAYKLAMTIIQDVLSLTGITATAGIGTNMYLAKIAMDVMAKKIPPDKDGVRIAELDEMSYRKELWNHKPLTDFWRIGKGSAKKLMANGLYTMGDIARCSLDKYGEDKLYKLFGINAELLIDHAWGYEPCTIDDIRKYKPENKSISEGQVLHCPYDFDKTRLIVREMLELLSLKLVEDHFVTNQIVLTVGYDIENLTNPEICKKYKGEITKDSYGRRVPKHSQGSANLEDYTSSTHIIIEKTLELFDKIINPTLLIRRLSVCANHVIDESDIKKPESFEQIDLFTDYEASESVRKDKELRLKKERAIQETTLYIKDKFGKNALLKGFNLKEGATTIERNKQIGGHSAGGCENDG